MENCLARHLAQHDVDILLTVAATLCAVVLAVPARAQHPAQPALCGQQPPPETPLATEPPTDEHDDDFIEFLGADDVGDAAWWEFLKKVPPRGENPPAPPPQEVKQ